MDIFSQHHILWLKRYQLLSLQPFCFQAWKVNFHLLSGFLWTRLLRRRQYYEAAIIVHSGVVLCISGTIWLLIESISLRHFWSYLTWSSVGIFQDYFFDKNSPSIMGRGWLDNQPKLIYSFLMWCIPWDMSKLCSGDIEYILSQSLYLMYRVETKMWAVLLVIWPCRKYMLWISLYIRVFIFYPPPWTFQW